MMNPLIRTPGRHLRRSAYSHCWLSTSPTPSLTHSSTRMSAIPRIVFENNHALVIDKPIGIAHHSNDDEDGIMKTMRSLQSEAGGDDVYSGDLYSVHRLDRDTSGLLLFAKTKSAASFFSKQFADRKVIKYYVAISNQKPSKKMGLISGDMAASRRSKQKLLRTQKDPAQTRFLTKTFDCGLGKVDSNDSDQTDDDVFAKYSTAAAPSLRAFLIRPLTGKKHQIRVMMRSLGAPVLGDPLYATKENFEKASSDRCYLHACAMRIAMPMPEKDADASATHSNTVQLVLPPKQGRLFTSPGFMDCWNSWAMPNMLDSESKSSVPSSKQFPLILGGEPIIYC